MNITDCAELQIISHWTYSGRKKFSPFHMWHQIPLTILWEEQGSCWVFSVIWANWMESFDATRTIRNFLEIKNFNHQFPFCRNWLITSIFFSQISIILLGNSNMEVKYHHKCSSDALNFRQISQYADTISITLLILLKSRKPRFTMLSKCINCTLWV